MVFRNTPIVTRLSLVFGLILLFVVGLGLFAWHSIRVLEEKSLATESAVMPVLEDAHQLEGLLAQHSALLKDYFIASRTETLSAGLEFLHDARRASASVLLRVESDPALSSLEAYLVSVNSLFEPYLREVQLALVAHDTLTQARATLYADVDAASRAVQELMLRHLDAAHAEREVFVATALLMQDIWKLCEMLARARVENTSDLARQAEMGWGPVLARVRGIPVVRGQDQCLAARQTLEKLTLKATASTGAYIDAWNRERHLLEQLSASSAFMQATVRRLGVAGGDLMARLAASATESAANSMRYTLLFTALASLLGLGLAVALGRDIARPLRRCLFFAQNVAVGNLGESLSLDRKDEIGRLATAITTMVGGLHRRIEEHAALAVAMRQATALGERALHMARAACWTIDPQKPGEYVPSPQMGALLHMELKDPRPLEEWYQWVADADADAVPRLRHGLEAVLCGEREIVDIPTPLRLPGSTDILWVRSLLEAVRDEDGQVITYMGITQDVTEYMRQQQVLEAATRAQSAFIASMSHEIRTPLNAIIGLGHLLRNTSLTARQSDYLAKSSAAAQLLLGLVNDILDLSKIRAGEMRLEAISFGMRALLRRVMDMAAGLDSAEGLHLEMRVADDVPDLLLGDPLRVQQVLTNLLTNACKFTDKGSVKLDVVLDSVPEALRDMLTNMPQRTMPQGEPVDISAYVAAGLPENLAGVMAGAAGVCRVRFTVTDTGMGMSPEQAARLFQPFMQADSSISRRFGGTGLGLAICRDLVALQGGELTVQSQRGQGSSFSFTAFFGRVGGGVGQEDALPCVDAHSLSPSARPSRILLAEDDDINALIAREILESMGHTVDVAVNGAEAVDMARSGEYRLVLMDLQMPVMDGLSAARSLRAVERLRSMPILAMTARTMHGDRARILEAGMDDHIPKPIDPQFLRDTLEKWL